MSELDEILSQNNIDVPSESTMTNKVIVTVNQKDQIFEYDQLGITFESSNDEILRAVNGIISEMNMDVSSIDDESGTTYVTRKATNSGNIYVYPKTVAGI